ncbi:MAG: methanogen output domain 1-containing protein [Candidatus Jordarchaeales archaeon]
MSEDLERLHRFITRVFALLMSRLDAIAGRETVRTVFRLVGESVGERVEARLRKKYGVDSWTPEKFVELLAMDIIAPAVGTDNVSFESSGGEMKVTFTVCPFEKLNFDITSKFYCTYTHGVIEEAARKALGDVEVKAEKLRSEGADKCVFTIRKIQ